MIGIKVIEKKPLNWIEKIYVVEALKGLRITTGHFFRNLGIHMAHRLGLMKKVRAAVTYQYPEESRPLASRLRTRHRLMKREDGSPRCVACMLCETVCPAKCIYIIAGEHPDPNIEKVAKKFDLDLGKCVYCGFCVEVCPEDAIRMDTHILDIAAFRREDMVLDMQELLNPGSRKKNPPPLT